jgi:hypothetical protein
MKIEVNNEDQHINHHMLIDYYQVIFELFLMLIYLNKKKIIEFLFQKFVNFIYN